MRILHEEGTLRLLNICVCMVHNAADGFNERAQSTGTAWPVMLAETWLAPA